MISAVVLVCRVCPAQQLLLICASLLCHPRCPNGHNSFCQFCHLLPSSLTPVLSSPVISFYLCQSPELWCPHFVLLRTAASPWLIFWLSHGRWPFLWPFRRCHYTWSSWKSSHGFFSVPFPCVLPLSAFGVYNEQCLSPHAPFCFDTALGRLSRFPAWPRFAWMLLLLPVCLLARIASFFLARLTVKLLLRLLGVSQRKSTDQGKCYQMLRG